MCVIAWLKYIIYKKINREFCKYKIHKKIVEGQKTLMNILDRFREYLHNNGPNKYYKMCPKCGRHSYHQLVYCRNCGKTTQSIKFDNWIDYSTYILSRKYNGKIDNPYINPLCEFEYMLKREKEHDGMNKRDSYMSVRGDMYKLTDKEAFIIIKEECGF